MLCKGNYHPKQQKSFYQKCILSEKVDRRNYIQLHSPNIMVAHKHKIKKKHKQHGRIIAAQTSALTKSPLSTKTKFLKLKLTALTNPRPDAVQTWFCALVCRLTISRGSKVVLSSVSRLSAPLRINSTDQSLMARVLTFTFHKIV